MKLTNIIDEMNIAKQGDHMVMLYDNDEYNTDIIAAYIVSRLHKNEKCFYIAGDSDVDLLKRKLALLTDIEDYIESGQLSILTKNDAYAKDGQFNPDRMIQLLQKLSSDAIKDGYNAFAVTGEISWVLEYDSGFDKIMEYEYKLNKYIFGEYPVSAICRYNLNKFSSEMIKNIIEVHPLIIWKGEIHDNPFYTDTVDETTVDVNEFYVASMLKRITEFTNTKSQYNQELEKQEKAYNALQVNLMKNIILSLTSLLEIHDTYTKDHSEHVARIARKIAIAAGLSQEEVSVIYFAGLVHDIGKTVIPSQVINKTSPLTDDEFEVIKKHSVYGYESLKKTPELEKIADLVHQHHERYNGKGYPLGNAGKDIPLGARILCIADAYDAMVNDRPYRNGMSKDEAIKEVLRCKGEQFDPMLVDVFVKLVNGYQFESLKK